MAKQTKRRLIAAFQQVLQEKPLDKITISDITDACKVNRMTFYYHFHDLDGLIDASFVLLSETAMADYRKEDPLMVSLSRLIMEMERQKDYLLRLHQELDHKIMVVRILDILQAPVQDHIEKCAGSTHLSRDHFLKIRTFYTSALTGVFMHWLEFGMADPAESVVSDLDSMLKGSCELMIRSFTEA